MPMFRRGMTFLAFLGSCIAVGLLIASLGTKRWLVAGAKRSSNPIESDGRIHFGLFDGRKELNVAYGWRAYDIDVVRQLRYEPELQIYGLWLGTVMSVCGALLMAAIGGVAAAHVAASNKCCCLVGRLYLWNTLALLCSLSAIGCFTAQYYLRLRNNVLTREDRDNLWSSEGRAQLGYSYWTVVGAAAACFVNLLTVWLAASSARSADSRGNAHHHHQFVNNGQLGPMIIPLVVAPQLVFYSFVRVLDAQSLVEYFWCCQMRINHTHFIVFIKRNVIFLYGFYLKIFAHERI